MSNMIHYYVNIVPLNNHMLEEKQTTCLHIRLLWIYTLFKWFYFSITNNYISYFSVAVTTWIKGISDYFWVTNNALVSY